MSKFYTFNINSEDSIFVLVFFIMYCVISAIIVSSFILIFLKKLKSCFEILPKSFWMIYNIGSLMIISAVLTFYGSPTTFKCHLKTVLVLDGLFISLCPIFYILATNFPIINKLSDWIKDNKYLFISVLILFEILLSILLFLTPNYLNYIIVEDGESFKRCTNYKSYGKIILNFQSYLHTFSNALYYYFTIF